MSIMRVFTPSSSTSTWEHLHEFEDDFPPRIAFRRNGSLACAAPLLLIDGLSGRSFSYCKLPPEPIELTVVKLDGSSFGIGVAKMATVAELKLAVEDAFSHLPKKGPGKVSWSHVWKNFCLCYGDQKLLTDSDYIGCYGIQEGDKLYFMHHKSINYNMIKKRSEKRFSDLEQPSPSDGFKGGENCEKHDQYADGGNFKNQHDADDSVMAHCEFGLSHLLKGCFSNRRVTNSEMKLELE